MEENCIFCKIIKKEIPARIIWEDDKILAFLDVKPVSPGHVLVIPKEHINYIFAMDDESYKEIWMQSKIIAEKLKDALNPTRVGVLVAGFQVPHVHIHLMPLEGESEIGLNRKELTDEQFAEIHEKIKVVLG